MTWMERILTLVLPAHCLVKIYGSRVDDAFDRARAARSAKVAAADDTIGANTRHRERIEGEAASIRARTQAQEARWPTGRTSAMRQQVDALVARKERRDRDH